MPGGPSRVPRSRLTRRGLRAALAATTALCLLAAGCSQASQSDGSGPRDDELAADTDTVPGWIQRAMAAAGATDPITAVDPPARRTTASEATSGLPSRTVVIPSLVAAGLTAEQAECVYTSLSETPSLTGELETLAATLSAAPAGSLNPASLSGVDPDAAARILASLAPCLDAGSLSLLLGGLGSAGSLAALLPSLASGDLDLAALSDLDLSGLDPAAAAAISGIISQAGSGGVPDLSQFDLSAFDLTTLDLSSIPPGQLPVLLLAIFSGLTPAQRNQLSSLAQVDFDRLGIDIDTENLTPEQIGGLLLLISPLAVAAVNPNGAAPPPGADPSQIYIPPGADLSQINPLNFVPRETVVQGAIEQGVSGAAAGCLFDNLRSISPLSLGSIFSTSPNPIAVAELALAAIRCVVAF